MLHDKRPKLRRERRERRERKEKEQQISYIDNQVDKDS